MTKLRTLAVLFLSAASCCSAFADSYSGTVNLSTPYTNSVSGWSELDDETVYVPPHSHLTVTDYDYGYDTIDNMTWQQDAELYSNWPASPQVGDVFINDSDEGAYYHLELESAVYTDSYDIVYCPASWAWLSYQIDDNPQ